MKPERKGQQVKTFKRFIPQPDLSSREQVIKVYFQASDGRFSIYGPDHVLAAIYGTDMKANGGCKDVTFWEDRISADTLDAVMSGLNSACFRYDAILREENKKQVICFEIKFNSHRSRGNRFRDDISFCAAPALHFRYEVLWQVGNRLYRQHDPEDSLHDVGTVTDADLVDWTPAREDFFRGMVDGIETLIERLVEFRNDLSGNTDLAIANMSAVLSLPAPKEPS